MTEWDEAAFRKLAEATADLLGLTAEPAYEHWHAAHLMAPNGTGWSLSSPSGYGAKGMTQISPVWPGRGWPPGRVHIKAGITASRGPEVIAARIRLLAPDYRLALAELAETQARDAAEQARRDEVAARIVAMLPDDAPEPDERYPRVRVSPVASGSSCTELYIAGAGTVEYYRDAGEIEIDRFRAPANVILAMLTAYAETPRQHVPLVPGPPPDYTHVLRGAEPPPQPERPLRLVPSGGSLPGPARAVRVARPELIAGAAWLLDAVEEKPG